VERGPGVSLYDIFVDAPDAPLAELRRASRPIVVDLPAKTYRRELPRVGPPPHHLDLPDDGAVAAHVEHWVHVLWLWPLLVPALARHRPGKKRRWRGAAPSFIGEDATIHHRAHVESAVIGPGAQVGSDASIASSYVGEGANIADFSKVTRSILGAETHTLADAAFSSCVSLGQGTLANLLLRDTILGKSVFLTSGVIFWNEAIERTIRVVHRGALADSERRNLGGCAGHGCVLGARTIVSPGRALPNRTTVVMRREEGVTRIEDGRGAPMCWFDGALVPASRVAGQQVDEVSA
jgi:carbonic anhydrase/acetyltransferase-like protein (isoleucine patch superfamily)